MGAHFALRVQLFWVLASICVSAGSSPSKQSGGSTIGAPRSSVDWVNDPRIPIEIRLQLSQLFSDRSALEWGINLQAMWGLYDEASNLPGAAETGEVAERTVNNSASLPTPLTKPLADFQLEEMIKGAVSSPSNQDLPTTPKATTADAEQKLQSINAQISSLEQRPDVAQALSDYQESIKSLAKSIESDPLGSPTPGSSDLSVLFNRLFQQNQTSHAKLRASQAAWGNALKAASEKVGQNHSQSQSASQTARVVPRDPSLSSITAEYRALFEAQQEAYRTWAVCASGGPDCFKPCPMMQFDAAMACNDRCTHMCDSQNAAWQKATDVFNQFSSANNCGLSVCYGSSTKK